MAESYTGQNDKGAFNTDESAAGSTVVVVGQENGLEEDEQTLIDNEVVPDGGGSVTEMVESKAWQKLGRKSTHRRKRKWYKHRGLKENRRTVVVTAIIDLLSLIALSSGIAILAIHNFDESTTDGIILLVVGAVMLIPGTYFSYFLWMASHDRPGYDFNSLKRFSFN